MTGLEVLGSLLPSLPQCWSWGLALCTLRLVRFSGAGCMYAQFFLSSHLSHEHPLHLSAKEFLITNLKFRMGRGWGWRSLSLSPSILPPPRHTSSPPLYHLHPHPHWGPDGVNGFDPTWFSPSARATVPFPKVAPLAEMCSLACDLNDYYITSHFTSKHRPKAPNPASSFTCSHSV